MHPASSVVTGRSTLGRSVLLVGASPTFDGTELTALAGAWPSLVAGDRQILDCFTANTRSFLVLVQSSVPARAPLLRGKAREMVERALLGQAQKVVASDLGVSPSTVAGTMRHTLGAMGLPCVASRAPLILSLLVQAYREPDDHGLARTARVTLLESNAMIVSIPSPDTVFLSKVSPAEKEVLLLRTEGMTHAEIARARRASARTVANQLASAWRKLGVSGRSELLRYLLKYQGDVPPEQIPVTTARARSSSHRPHLTHAQGVSSPGAMTRTVLPGFGV